MKKSVVKILLVLFCFIGIRANSQNPALTFAEKFSTATIATLEDCIVSGMQSDAAGNIWVVGNIYDNSTHDFDPSASTYNLTGIGICSFFYAKYSNSGALIFAYLIPGAQTLGGQPAGIHDMALDGSGNLLMAGIFTGQNVDFDPSPGSFLLSSTNTNHSNIIVAKYDNNGNFVFAKTYPEGAGSNTTHSYAIVADANDNYYISGIGGTNINFGGTTLPAFTKDYFAKYNSSGNLIYAKALVGNSFAVTTADMSLDQSGNLYITGTFDNTLDMDPGAATFNLIGVASGEPEIFISKYDASGNFIFAKKIGDNGSQTEYVHDIETDAVGNVYLCGAFTGSNFDADPGGGTAILSSGSNSSSSRDGFIAKYDNAGNYLFARRFGTSSGLDAASDLEVTSSGLMYVTGSFTNTVDFDLGAGTQNLTGALADAQVSFIATYNTSDASFVNVFQLHASPSFFFANERQRLFVDRDINNSLIYAGWFACCQNNADLDPGAGTSFFTSGTLEALILAKYAALPTWYQDFDADGYGNPLVTQSSGSQPSGYVANSTDCNDADANQHPGQIWYVDADDDDYGTGTTTTQCLRPSNAFLDTELIATSGDCNDDNAAIHPGSVEVCNSLDDNCNTLIDEGLSIPSVSNPISLIKCPGESASFSTTATGTAPLSYQWRKNSAPISGATNAAFTIGSILTTDAGNYDVIVSNACGSTTSSVATLGITTYSITANAGSNGTITPTGITTVNCGSNLIYTITPDANNVIADVLIDNVSAGAVSSYTFSNVQGNHTISATFMSSTHIICSLSNCATTSPNTFEFDLYILNDGPAALKLNSLAYGITVNSEILENTADALTLTYVGGSQLPAAITNTFTFSYASGIRQLKLISSAFAVNYSNAPSLPNGTPVKVGRFKVTNTSGNWATASTTNLSLNTTTGGFNTNTGANVYAGINPVTIAANNSITRSVLVGCSLTLNCTPTITCATDISVNNDAGVCGAIVSYAAPSSTGCPGTQIIQTGGLASGATFPVGITTNTFKAVDPSGNFSTCSFTVTVTDQENPAVPTLATATGECSVSVIAPTTTDNCAGTVTGTTTDPLTYNTQGTFIIHWIFDDAHGNISSANQTVIVDDVTPPAVPILANATGECSVSVIAPITTDNCAGTVTGTTTDPLTYNTQGTFTIHWIFDDGNGNTAAANQLVIVDDMTAPVPDVLTLALVTDECGVTLTAPSASDNCVGTVIGTTTEPTVYSSQGTFIVHWYFDDGNGNVSSQDQTVIVDDVTPPSITCPTTVTVSANASGCSATGVALGNPSGSDNCGGISYSNDAPSSFPLGTTTVTWTANDGHGNTSTCTQSVTVTNPALINIAETDNSGPVANDGILCTSGGGATLAVTGASTYSWSPSTGLNQTTGATVIATPSVTTVYTVTGTTATGCQATATYTVTVQTCVSAITVKFFIQGYYNTAGLMKPVLHNQGKEANALSSNVDTVVIQLHPAANPSVAAYSFKGLLQTDGTIACIFPDAVVGSSYYVVIKHRGALQTWSASPVNFAYSNTYDFSTAANRAFWDNMIQLEPGVWAIYNGDLNQDESIDIYDAPPFDYDIQHFLYGYLNTDINGDGSVDIYDSPILDFNSQNFVGSIHP